MTEPRTGRRELTPIRFEFSRSSGPGGQHVNKVETRVTLLFDLDATTDLTEEEKARVRARLAGRINREGLLRVVSQRHRTRERNRQAALERFAELIEAALAVSKTRKKTRTPATAERRRIEVKRQRGETKRGRGKGGWED